MEEFSPTERDTLRILKAFVNRKAVSAQQTQRELVEANQLLQDYLQLLAKSRGIEGEGWQVTPDLTRFVRSEGPGVRSLPLQAGQKPEESGERA